MDILFYTSILLLIVLLPIGFSVEGAFNLDRKIAFASIRIFGMKLLRIKLYFAQDGLYFSVNGKEGKMLSHKDKERKGKEKKRRKANLFFALYFREIILTAYIGGDPQSLSLFLGGALISLDAALEYLDKIGRLDERKVRILPCYVGNQSTVNFSISVFSSIALLLSTLAHTTEGGNYAKRSDRKHYG